MEETEKHELCMRRSRLNGEIVGYERYLKRLKEGKTHSRYMVTHHKKEEEFCDKEVTRYEDFLKQAIEIRGRVQDKISETEAG
ncbi:hypothetical protein KA005_53195 [bacterium]|nr:hypothetical protein [bacterium]